VDFDTRYSKLNARQKEAVDTIDGPVMVVAGPGTGKTELLSMRVANILRRTDTLPENILCLTFTESGATAMRQRLTEIIGPQAYKVAIHTFHSFGSEVISQYGEYFYHGAQFRPASDLNSYEVLRSIFDELDFSSPLAGKMNEEYTHLPDTLSTISELKKSGLTNEELLRLLDANDFVLDSVERELANVFSNRVTSKIIPQLSTIAKKLADLPPQELPPGIAPLSNVLALGLERAIAEADESNSTKPITKWKNTHLEKDEEGNHVFKDRKRTRKLRALSYLYYQYLMKMQEAELYDFDDMVLRVVHALEVFPDLRYNLQERYLYMMVDEFQDTNMAQARILYDLAETPSGDAPNVMVVGDDDQAIYSFQGAEVGNILSFRDKYEAVKIITLTDNYRSAKPVLTAARAVITQGNDRLERYLEGIDKSLTAHRPSAGSTVTLTRYMRIEDERRGVVAAIAQKIKAGQDPSTITVIARRHHELVELLPYFADRSIAVNYERRDNVLESDVIAQLLLLSRIVCHLATGEIGQADALLPQLVAHPAWGFEAESVWKLSLSAYAHHGTWLEQMSVTPEFKPLHNWLIEQSRVVDSSPAERVIDQLVGNPNEDRDDGSYHSPLFTHYFSDERRTTQPDTYVVYLEALRTIRAKLREYRPNQSMRLSDFIEFIELHQRMGAAITSVRVRSDSPVAAVNLMTAHKSKGLEYDSIYIVGAVDTSWGEQVRARSRLIGYPANLPIRPSGDSLEERLRLFFVAMTRAKKSLSISYSSVAENGRELLPASFLLGTDLSAVQAETNANENDLAHQLLQEWYQPLVSVPSNTMQRVLSSVLSGYKLSVTHLTSFLDITRGGPQQFLLNHLLHFPTSKAPSALYGSAIHSTLQRAHNHLLANGKKKPVEDVLQDFEQALAGYHLPPDEFQSYLQRGTANLTAFLAARYDTFNDNQKVEIGFGSQQSMVGNAILTGAIDLADINAEIREFVVTDYKTGAPSTRWQGKTDGEKLKLHKYKQQLMFYKLLVEHSRDFGNYVVTKGVLQFVEPTLNGQVVNLDLTFNEDELEDFTRLIENVYKLITTLTLPDIADYPASFAGVTAFEADIIAGKY
jgi:DNA helicase-2/ATP-dependent DNA helicase PcrA